MKIHKLKFPSRADFEAFITDDPCIRAIAIVAETGLIPYPTEFDEDGNALPVTFREGFHVDVMTTEVIQEWKQQTVTGAHEWYHGFGRGETVTAEDFETELPNDTWTKSEIQTYLTNNGIEWKQSWSKAQLLAAV